ncbi:type II toxin-antitoxin system HigB family toxin [Algoriphagus hitonicola]|uniref:HigB_toxin, RelE-like toxic component of a toxin-antitoxin system n=1 Tax=Algoriphagus hitonicola TaxID=435880 RepID=A0A1I2T0I2_9BACT|nr:type II toxin-antitoxin system HigB family toxin [Algoriphagus hitonicola]SFG58340.1 HigB_toxin, RelE-like toxic component of a toxin-antitoxin system [Algoriphagus hitonicola]
MRLINKKLLEKLKRKNKGNSSLNLAIDALISDIAENNWTNQIDLKKSRPDADCVHSDGFYFFNIAICRTMILVEFDDLEATVVWAGSHSDYEKTFQNNKRTIKKWLRNKEWI